MDQNNNFNNNGNQANQQNNMQNNTQGNQQNGVFVPFNYLAQPVQQPVKNNQSKNINNTALNKLIKNAEQKKANKGSNNPIFSYYDKQAKEKADINANEARVRSYAEVTENFKRVFGKEAQGGLNSIEGINNVDDRTEYLARAIIKKAFPNDKTIQAQLQDRSLSALDKSGALYVRYTDALKHFDKAGKTTSSFYRMNTQNVSKSTLKNIQAGLYDYRYKEKAKAMAKEIGLIK